MDEDRHISRPAYEIMRLGGSENNIFVQGLAMNKKNYVGATIYSAS
jgi:hypothetical protein